MGVKLGVDRVYSGGAKVAGGTLVLPDGRFVSAGEAHDLIPVQIPLDSNGSCTIPGDVPAAEYYFQALDANGDNPPGYEGNMRIE